MKHKKHKGFTLVEVLVAFAVLGIAVLGIGGFFVSAARSYSSVSDETSLQYEAQLALNQVENMLIDSTLGVSYNYVTGAETPSEENYQFVEKDSDASGTAVSKVLYAYNVNETNGAKLDVLLMKWLAAEKKIYYKVVNVEDTGAADNTIDKINISQNIGGWDLLAEDVASFAVDLSEYAKTKKVEIDLGFENRSKDYQTSGTVLLRNNVLINENDIHKIYEHVTKVIKSQITGLELTANTDVTVPGGVVQLKAKVLGTGYPSQEIQRWIVASDSNFTTVLYDSAVTYETMPKTYLDTVSQVLYVSDDTTGSGSTFNEMLYVKAVVDTDSTQEGENPEDDDIVASVSIGVKLISNIEVSVAADTTMANNSNLQNATFDTASLVDQRANTNEVPTMTLHPKNIVKLTASVTASDTSTAEDKAIIWSILSKTEGVVAEIDNSGTLQINQYSKIGTFIVRASLKLNSSVYVDYIVEVGTQYNAENSKLEITTSKKTINRGGNTTCSLKLNGADVDNSDYDWSVSVISSNGQEISGTPVTVNAQGGVYANYDLSYDYSYDVWIKAALKVNPAITAMAKITVPKVSLTVSPGNSYCKMGNTVSGITCTAVGLEEYDIKWAMAKEQNPKYFFTAWGNFNITGSKNTNGEGVATVVMGTTEDPPTNATVKAYLKNNTNYSATMKIFTGDVRLEIHGDPTVERGNTLELNLTVSDNPNNIITVTKETAGWEIADVKVDGESMPGLLDDDTISISEGLLTVHENFAADYEYKNVVLTIRAYDDAYNLADTHTVTIQRKEIIIFPDGILIPNLSGDTTIQYTHYDGATWSVQKERTGGYPGWGGGDEDSKITIENDGKLTADGLGSDSDDNATYIVTIRLGEESKSGKLRYGFETNPRTTEVGRYSEGGYTYVYSVGMSEYYVYDNGKFYPVYYVNVVSRNSYRPGQNNQNTRYVFISSKTKDEELDANSGQWYIYNSSGYSVSRSAPTGWENTYFNK